MYGNPSVQPLWYSLLDKVYYLVNYQSCHTRVVYWGNTRKYASSRAGPILAFPVLAQLYGSIFSSIDPPSSQFWQGSFENLRQGELLMSPIIFLSTRSYQIWPRSAMGYKEIVYLKHSGATLATHQAGKNLGLSACLDQGQSKYQKVSSTNTHGWKHEVQFKKNI